MGQVQEKQLIPVTYSTPETKAPIECQLYYHGFLEQEDAEEVLKEKGDFLVRKTKLGEQEEMVLSVLGSQCHHIFVLSNRNNSFRFETTSYPTVHDLVFNHWRKKAPITVKSGAILLRAIPRTRWEPYTEKEMKAANKRKGSFGENSILPPIIPPVPTMSGCNTLQSNWSANFNNNHRASSLKLLPLPNDLLPPPPPHLNPIGTPGYYETPDGRSTISSRHNLHVMDEAYPSSPAFGMTEITSLRRNIPIHALTSQEKRERKLELQIEVLELEKEKLMRQLGKNPQGYTDV